MITYIMPEEDFKISLFISLLTSTNQNADPKNIYSEVNVFIYLFIHNFDCYLIILYLFMIIDSFCVHKGFSVFIYLFFV